MFFKYSLQKFKQNKNKTGDMPSRNLTQMVFIDRLYIKFGMQLKLENTNG